MTMKVILLLLLTTGTMATTPTEVFTGTIINKLPHVKVYESTIPMTFQLPFHHIDPDTIQTVTTEDTPTTNTQEARDIQNSLHILQSNIKRLLLTQNAKFKSTLTPTTNRTRRSIQFIGDFLSWCCSIATTDNLAAIAENEKTVDSKMNTLSDFLHDEHTDLLDTQLQMQNFSTDMTGVLHKIHNSMDTWEYELTQTTNTTINYVITQIQQYIQQTWMYTYLTLYFENLNTIQQDCQDRRLSKLLISEETLQTQLLKLQTNLQPLNLTLVLQKAKTYYYEQITICNFHDNGIFITLQIPVKKTTSEYTAYQYSPIPLLWKDNICTIAHNNFILVKGPKQVTSIPHDDSTCDTTKSTICAIPRGNFNKDIPTTCANTIIAEHNIQSLQQNCHFHCVPRPNYPIITQLQANHFLITNHQTILTITCTNLTNTTTILPTTLGTTEIHLPCHCKLHSLRETYIDTTAPCDKRDFKTPQTIHLIPISWTNLLSMKIDPMAHTNRPQFHNVTQILDTNWTFHTPVYHIHPMIKEDTFKHITLPNTWDEIIEHRTFITYAIFIWSSILTVFITISCYQIHILKIKLKLMKPKPHHKDYETEM